MHVYQVGGSVRDMLMNKPSKDRDWVVIGATPEDMLALGYTQVGADFPVFLHPVTGDEFALARTERKTGAGYLGFEVEVENVTLEDDLKRRDLTINAIALDQGRAIDPYGGAADIQRKVFRHVSDAFTDDPVRILRVLRFHARFGPEWRIAEETEALIHKMVANGEASNLVAERIWKESSRALMEPYAQLYLQGLEKFGLTRLPCFSAYRHVWAAVASLKAAARSQQSFPARCALVFGDTLAPKDCPPGFPTDIWQSVRAWSKFGSDSRLFEPSKDPENTLQFFEAVHLFRSTAVLETLLECWNVLDKFTPRLWKAASRALSVDTKTISGAMPKGKEVGEAIRRARLEAIRGSSSS